MLGLVLALSVKHSSICWGLCWPYLLNIAPYVGGLCWPYLLIAPYGGLCGYYHSSICWGLCWPYLLNIAPYVGACVGPIC